MSGIILLLVLAIWLYIAKKISGFCVTNMQAGNIKTAINILLFLLFFIAPVADDIIGGFQFRALCKSGSMLIYESEKVKNKTVMLKDTPDITISKIISIREQTWDWVDPNTGESLIKYKYYYAKGGWLSRLIGFPQGSPPYTFYGKCSSKNHQLIFKQLNITKNVKKYYGE